MMQEHFKVCLLILLFEGYLIKTGEAQSLQLQDQGLTVQNRIELYVSNETYQNILQSRGQKLALRKSTCVINGDTVSSQDIHIRGKASTYFPRKSFSFDMQTRASFQSGANTYSSRKFYANNLSMDKFYFRNRFAFRLMKELELFHLYNAYGELSLNNRTQGIYLIIERPQDWALKKMGSPLVLRRGFDQKIRKLKTDKSVTKDEAKEYRRYYQSIYKSLKKLHGEPLYDSLSQWLDLEQYMRWLAFNFFVKNGDYTDEAYLYIDPVEKRYKVIPWDYDDIFASEPHEGSKSKLKKIGDKLIFSSEDLLDQKIALDPFLYEKYLEQFKAMLESMSADQLGEIFESIYAELYPYYLREDILEVHQQDAYKGASLQSLQENMQLIYDHLLTSKEKSLIRLKLELQ